MAKKTKKEEYDISEELENDELSDAQQNIENGSLLDELQAENKKSKMFEEFDVGISYPIGQPILDQMLGFKQTITLESGEEIIQKRLGVPAGTHTCIVGVSQSGKSAFAVQSAYNIIEPFSSDASMIIFAGERGIDTQRVLDLTGMSTEEYSHRVRIIDDPLLITFENTLNTIVKICNKKAADPDRYMYNTGFYSCKTKREIKYYIPTVVIIDSLFCMVSENDEIDELANQAENARYAQLRKKWYRNTLAYARLYNINIFMVNHLGNNIKMDLSAPLPNKHGIYLPNGKNIPGGDAVTYLTASIILLQPDKTKDTIKTKEDGGYYGYPVNAMISKARSGYGGNIATLEFVQDLGFDPLLTLINFAKSKDLIGGKNPSRYFKSHPDIKFDTRNFLDDIAKNPEITDILFEECSPLLEELIRIPPKENEPVRGASARKHARQLLRKIY